MNSILCFTNGSCPFKGELMGFEGEQIRSRPKPYFRCRAKSLEQMALGPCVMKEDKDLKNYGVKVIVKNKDKFKAWDPKKVIVLRSDRDEQFDGTVYERLEV